MGLALVVGPLQASGRAREQRRVDKIVDMLMVGEDTWLEVGKEKILTPVTEHTIENATGGAIVVHGIGAHPGWPQGIHPLRSQLPDHGRTTLSVQMPILENQAGAADYEPLFAEEVTR